MSVSYGVELGFSVPFDELPLTEREQGIYFF